MKLGDRLKYEGEILELTKIDPDKNLFTKIWEWVTDSNEARCYVFTNINHRCDKVYFSKEGFFDSSGYYKLLISESNEK